MIHREISDIVFALLYLSKQVDCLTINHCMFWSYNTSFLILYLKRWKNQQSEFSFLFVIVYWTVCAIRKNFRWLRVCKAPVILRSSLIDMCRVEGKSPYTLHPVYMFPVELWNSHTAEFLIYLYKLLLT